MRIYAIVAAIFLSLPAHGATCSNLVSADNAKIQVKFIDDYIMEHFYLSVDGRHAGHITYRLMDNKDAIFVVTMDVSSRLRGLGLSTRLLKAVTERHPRIHVIKAILSGTNEIAVDTATDFYLNWLKDHPEQMRKFKEDAKSIMTMDLPEVPRETLPYSPLRWTISLDHLFYAGLRGVWNSPFARSMRALGFTEIDVDSATVTGKSYLVTFFRKLTPSQQ